ncbi:hypothetical protein SLEP1_g53618 [Rubroshorea leprosula]|uniref:Uncharacterized protein n=1 Tax=Rubroshorea leprosula TaxID=152421 RepID=A0AAV5M9W5_9ROSI|nr:hypothetical protein SLEP1_g53618 [Rubroshorea leprosula]
MCMSLNVIGAAWKDFCRLDVIEMEKMGWLERGFRERQEDESNGDVGQWRICVWNSRQPTVYREPQLDIKKLRDPEEFFERHYYELTPFHVCHVAAQERTGAVLMDWDLNNLSMSERPRQLWKVIASPPVELARAGERVFYFP